ncbi:MAG: bifunctional phosphoserine phosphatase/homoserine phosphotransferase ThrH [Rhodospirillales bacterium]|nr:bifunctional phosphoserine phosphatase/homoserine phosphotransferase ThrH [Rhodospirillales bacterium]
MDLVCLDLEGVLVPEVWINVAKATGVDSLSLTTRDIPDYDTLMRHRLGLLDEHNLSLDDIQAVIGEMAPLPGATDFLDWLRRRGPVVILSDTFTQFAAPLMRQLGWPTLFCHQLEVDENSRITDYTLRIKDHKRLAVEAFRALRFTVTAVGDSYNDTTMLTAADKGILFRAPDNVIREFPQFPHVNDYDSLATAIAT